MAAATNRRRVRRAALALALAALVATAVGVAAAADATTIGVSPATDSVEAGDTTSVDVVVENADGGVGALNVTLTLSNPDVASVEDVTIHGEPELTDVTERDDGVALSAALADTDDTGSVTIATVVLEGENPGATAVDVDVRVLGDEEGASYSVEGTESPTVTVTESERSFLDLELDGWPFPPEDDGDADDPEGGEGDGDQGDSGDGDGAGDGGDADDPEDGESGNDGLLDIDLPFDQDSADLANDEQADQLATTPGGELSPLFGPAGAVVVIGAAALALYRFW